MDTIDDIRVRSKVRLDVSQLALLFGPCSAVATWTVKDDNVYAASPTGSKMSDG